MQPLLFAVPLPRGLTVSEGNTLCLAADETKRQQYLRRPQLPNAQQSLVSQAMLRYAAARTLGAPMKSIRIAYTDRGKPYLPGTNLFCSVSHTDKLCVCVLADEEVGVDAERIRPHVPRIVTRVFSPQEQEMLQEGLKAARKLVKRVAELEEAKKEAEEGVMNS